MKKIYKGTIPFGDFPEIMYNGKIIREAEVRQLDYPHIPGGEVIWKDNIPFTANLKIKSYSRGRSASNWDAQIFEVYCYENLKYEKFLQNVCVNIFMVDMLEIILHNDIFHGVTKTRDFIFCKRGQNYGITLLDNELSKS